MRRYSPEGLSFRLVRRRSTKLAYLDAAVSLDDLKSPPGNMLEALKKDRIGQHGIRINDQFRVCLVWRDGNADDVEVTDDH